MLEGDTHFDAIDRDSAVATANRLTRKSRDPFQEWDAGREIAAQGDEPSEPFRWFDQNNF